MIQTLKDITSKSFKDTTERTKWVRNWPSMIVLAVNMIKWTAFSEIAIVNQNRSKEEIEEDERKKKNADAFNF